MVLHSSKLFMIKTKPKSFLTTLWKRPFFEFEVALKAILLAVISIDRLSMCQGMESVALKFVIKLNCIFCMKQSQNTLYFSFSSENKLLNQGSEFFFSQLSLKFLSIVRPKTFRV